MHRIAFVIPTLDQSGAERQLCLLATGLPRDRYLTKVFTLNRGGYYLECLKAANIEVEVIGKHFRFDPTCCLRLRKALRAFRPDLVQSFLFSANSCVRLPGILPRGLPCIVSERCVDSWKSAWQLRLDRLLVNRMSAMTANSKSVAEFYSNLGVDPAKITVIPNAIEAPRISISRDEARLQLGIQPHEKVVGFVGRLAPQKRLLDLVWGFQLLQQIIEPVRLVLIGAGPEERAVREFASGFDCNDKIVFAGHRKNATELMQAFDAFVLPSEFEGMSNSLMEAMCLRIPCVVSDIPANRELIIHEVNGLTFPLGSGPDLTRRILRLFQNPDFSQTLGLAAASLIQQNHTVAQFIERHESLYRALLS